MVYHLNNSKGPQKFAGFVFVLSLFFLFLSTTLCHWFSLVLILVFLADSESSLVSSLAWLGLSNLVVFSGLV